MAFRINQKRDRMETVRASELRIGNLVEYPAWNNDDSKAYFSIRDIYFDEGKIGLTNGIIKIPCSHLDFIKPIPLTEEWLLKFGFDKWNDYCYCNSKIAVEGLFKKFNESICLLRCGNDDYVELTEIKYVNQLQNLYFALTGEELEINN